MSAISTDFLGDKCLVLILDNSKDFKNLGIIITLKVKMTFGEHFHLKCFGKVK